MCQDAKTMNCETAVVRAAYAPTGRIGVVTLEAPAIAASVKPGQFVHAQLPNMEAHVLRRPYSVFDARPEEGCIDLMVQQVGTGSAAFCALKVGETCSLVGPIGHGWQMPAPCSDMVPKRALLVVGGLGAAPLTMMGRALREAGWELTLVIGARDAENLRAHERLTGMADTLLVATDNGEVGHHGFCTDVLAQLLAEDTAFDYAAVCGPPMMEKLVCSQLLAAAIPTEVSLERHMACGIGVCLSCVVDTADGRKRACVDGPVFDAAKVVW